jgi:7-keto-8-aminopelargonate synthetase-like enzyme
MLAAPLQQVDRTGVRHGRRVLAYFGGCDYFRLSSHPEVVRALHEGVEKHGLNVAASRTTTGNHRLFLRLEKELAKFFGVERAALLSNGYATNLAFAQTFAGEFTHALLDARAHGSLRDAALLVGCPAQEFRHRDAGDLARVLAKLGSRARPLVMTDGMFSHDGSIAPLAEYLALLPRHGRLLVDDTHGVGTLGRRGRGTPELCGVRDARMVQTITLSKAFGVYGGAVLGPAAVIDAVQSRSRLFIGNTPPPLPLVNAALASLKVLRSDRSLRARLTSNIGRVKLLLRRHGWDTPMLNTPAPIIAVVPRSTAHAARLKRALLRAGVFPSFISYAGGTPYFRFALSSEHTAAQLDALAQTLIHNA